MRVLCFAVGTKPAKVVAMNPPTDPAIEAARRAGFDLDFLDSNLALSPEKRWWQHNLALEMALELQQARPVRDSKLRSTPSPAR